MTSPIPVQKKRWSWKKIALVLVIGYTVVGGFGFFAMHLERDKKQAADAAKRDAELLAIAEQEKSFAALTPLQHLEKGKADAAARDKHFAAIPKGSKEFRDKEAWIAEQARIAEEARLQAEINANPLVVVSSEWSKEGFGTISRWTVKFLNRSKRPIGNITYKTAYFSETGNLVDKGGVDSLLHRAPIQKVIPPDSTRTIEVDDGFLNKEAHKASFALVAWEFVKDAR